MPSSFSPVSNASTDRALYLRLLAYVKPYKKAFSLAVLCLIGTAAAEPVFPALLKYLIDNGFQATDTRMIWLIPSGIVLFFLVRSVFVYLTGYLMAWVSSNVITDLRRALFAKLVTLPAQDYDNQTAGQLISRVVNDVSMVTDSVTSVLVTLVRESLTAVAVLAYLLYLDWQLTLITLTVGPLIILTVRRFNKRMREASHNSLAALRLISLTIEETVVAQKVIKIFDGQARQMERFREATERFRRNQMREAIPASATTPITHLATSLALAIIVYLALKQSTGHAGATAGGFVSFITSLLLLIGPLKQLANINTQLQRGLAAAENLFELLDTSSEIDPHFSVLLGNTGGNVNGRVRGEIIFENVCFQYPGAEHRALTDISFSVPAGKTVALVGASGGGKTTISTLIPRFYSPDSGRILIDGVDIQSVSLSSLRRAIALVSQEVILFNDTVEANIAFGAAGSCTRETVIEAAKSANAWEFIQQLPQGLDSAIGENGNKLSGGQRQRIAIARSLLKNAPILILDEATSALDNESEQFIQSALTTLAKGRTTLVIAHRLSTIEHADFILVLNEGKLVERGTHTELLELGGYYAKLHQMKEPGFAL